MKQKNPILEKAGKTVLFALTLSITIYSCKKIEEKSTGPNRSMQNVVTKSGDPSYKNPSNPYDYIGQQHNDGLDYIRIHIMSWNAEPVSIDDSLYALTVRYMSETHGVAPHVTNEALNTLNEYNDVEMNPDIAIQMIENGEMSANAKMHLSALINSTGKYSDYDQFETKISEIKNIESNILADETLTTEERITLLGGASIARHSAYWSNQHPDPWPSDTSPARLFWTRDVINSFSDLIGYIVGRESGHPIVDSLALAIACSALGLAYLAYGM